MESVLRRLSQEGQTLNVTFTLKSYQIISRFVSARDTTKAPNWIQLEKLKKKN